MSDPVLIRGAECVDAVECDLLDAALRADLILDDRRRAEAVRRHSAAEGVEVGSVDVCAAYRRANPTEWSDVFDRETVIGLALLDSLGFTDSPDSAGWLE